MSPFRKQLAEFLQSSVDFQILHSSSQLVAETTSRICVLDSSFNPPHLAHYRLILESLNHNYNGETPKQRAILLLLSINNADKLAATEEEYLHRLDMMYLMAKDLETKFPIASSVLIGLTRHARFLDKSICIERHFPVKLTFLVGFDTLARIFNPKYYFPDKISHSLEDFIQRTDLFCLPRNIPAADSEAQLSYAEDIKKGLYDHIPSHWGESIHIKSDFDKSLENISSTSIRKRIKEGDSSWETEVIPSIKEYIEENHLYRK